MPAMVRGFSSSCIARRRITRASWSGTRVPASSHQVVWQSEHQRQTSAPVTSMLTTWACSHTLGPPQPVVTLAGAIWAPLAGWLGRASWG